MAETKSLLTNRVGIGALLALVVGNAISIPIFVLPGELAPRAGPSVVLAAVAAAVPAALVVLYNAQLGSAMPVAGGLYVYISRLTAPFWGFLVPFTLPVVNWATLLFTAIGFARYVGYFVDIPAIVLVYVFLVGVLAINLLGIEAVAKAQIVFAVLLFGSLAVFIVPGIPAIEPSRFAAPFSEGLSGFGVAVVALYFPYLGFGLVTELGEEIDDPGRSIPIALLVGIGIVSVVYVALLAVYVGVMPIEQIADSPEAPVATAAGQFLPPWAVGVVALGALFAIASTVNTTLLVSSRTVMRAARDGILPERLASIHPRLETPHVSILALGVPPLFFAAFVRSEVVELAAFIALAVLTAMFFSAIALWNLPREFPEHYENATLKLRRNRGLLVAVLAGLVTSFLLWVGSLVALPAAGILLNLWFLIGYVYYRYRLVAQPEVGVRANLGVFVGRLTPGESHVDHADGVPLFDRMVTLDEHEQAFAQRQTYEGAEESQSVKGTAGE